MRFLFFFFGVLALGAHAKTSSTKRRKNVSILRRKLQHRNKLVQEIPINALGSSQVFAQELTDAAQKNEVQSAITVVSASNELSAKGENSGIEDDLEGIVDQIAKIIEQQAQEAEANICKITDICQDERAEDEAGDFNYVGVMICLGNHKDNLSPPCKEGLKSPAYLCAADVTQLCPKALTEDEEEDCVRKNYPKGTLSKVCTDSVDKLEKAQEEMDKQQQETIDGLLGGYSDDDYDENRKLDKNLDMIQLWSSPSHPSLFSSKSLLGLFKCSPDSSEDATVPALPAPSSDNE